MTQDSSDRLDRIEATLERVSQQLDNQVVVNAELRQSTAELRQTADELVHSVNALVETANIHQQGLELLVTELRQQRTDTQQRFEILATELRQQRTDISQLQDFQRTASAALERISTVLDYLVRQSAGSNEQ